VFRAVGTIVFASAMASCASTKGQAEAPAPDSGEVAPATVDAVAASSVYLAPPWKKVYREGKRVITREAAALPDSPSKWVIDEFESQDPALRGALVRRTYLERGNDGTVFLNGLDLAGEGRILTFDPALVLMPASLSAAKPCLSESDALMRNSEDPGATRSHGHAIQTTRLVRATAASARIESELEAKFDFTTVDRSVTMEVAPGRGIVKEVQERTVKFGLFNLSRTKSSVVLVEQTTGAP
jgi:hypothetical protein